jgi:hypothetical protein
MDLKRRLSVKAQLPLKKKQNSKTFPLTWDQKNNSRVGINNKFVLNKFKVTAGVGNRYSSGGGSGAPWWLAVVTIFRTRWYYIIGLGCSVVLSYGYGVFVLCELWGVTWEEADLQALVEALQLKPVGGYDGKYVPPTPQPALLAEDFPPSKEDANNPKLPKVRNKYVDLMLTCVYFASFTWGVAHCVKLASIIFKS